MEPQDNTVSIIDPLLDGRWNEFVESHPNGWLCHLAGWKKLLEECFSHIKGYCLVKYNPSTNAICAGLPIYLVNSFLTGKRLVSTPFATLFDPLYSDTNDMRLLAEAAIGLYQKYGASFIEIRSFQTNGFENDPRFQPNLSYKHHYLELTEAPEILKTRFHRTCIRQRISRSLESNIQLKIGKNQKDINDFYSLYLLTRKRTCLPPMPRRFFNTLWDIFSSSGKISLLLAQHEKEIVAALILFKYKNRVSAEFAASNEHHKDKSPNHFLFWQAINLAYDQGFTVFDFGRTSVNNASLMDFKRHWGTSIIDLPYYLYDNHGTSEVKPAENKMGYKMAKKLSAVVPLRIYPVFGEFCYRHLG